MIVGKTLKAKKNSLKLSPKTNRAPVSEKSSSDVKTSPIQAKNMSPNVVFRIRMANTNCMIVPAISTRQGMIRLWELINHASSSMTT